MALAGIGADAYAAIQVGVLPFQNTGGPEYEQLSAGLQAMVTTDLAYSDDLVVVERARMQDLLGELDFNRTQYVDPATAQQIGKVVGATHMVIGTYMVVNDTMRIDANLVEVKTGVVVVPSKIEGESAAFFELEKDLVKAFLAGLGAVLSPKERADIARIQTADFDHFTQFSQAVVLYDADRYNESIAILEQLSREEPTFTLASVTLEEIRELQRQVEDKARAARIAESEQEFVAHQAGAARDAERIAALRAIGGDASKTFQERVTANLMLVQLDVLNSVFRDLKESTDTFALARAGERAYQAVWSELRPQVPKWFPVMDHPSLLADHDRPLDEVMAYNLRNWFNEGPSGKYTSLSSCGEKAHRITVGERGDDDELGRLWVPYARQVELWRELVEASRGCTKDYAAQRIALAEAYSALGNTAASTAILQALSKESTDADFLSRLVPRIERNQEVQSVLDQFPAGSLAREALLPVAPGAVGFRPDKAKELKERPEMVPFRLAQLRSELPGPDPFFQVPLFMNGLPTWLLTRTALEVQTGPRTSADETRALRHYRDLRPVESYGQRIAEPPLVAVIGGVPKSNVTAKVTVDFRPAEDWYPRQLGPTKPAGWAPLPDRPVAGLLFGLKELATMAVCDPMDKTKVTSIPTTGYAAVVQQGKLVIAEVVEVFPTAERCGVSGPPPVERLEVRAPLASKPLTKPTAEIVLTVKDRVVTATAGGTTVTVTLKAAPSGFVGLYAEGPGYVELRDPAL